MEKKITQPGALTFKGRPLVRCDKTIYYGDMGDKYVAMLQIREEQSVRCAQYRLDLAGTSAEQ